MKKWRLVSKKQVFDNKWLQVEDRIYTLPDGTSDHYFHVSRPNYVLVIAENEQNQVLLVRIYRRGVDAILTEFIAGWIELGESALTAATRELQEETGWVAKQPKILGELYSQPGFMDKKAIVVCANVSEKINQNREKEEQLSVFWKYPNEIDAMIKKGRIVDMGSIAAWQLYKLDKGI